MEDAMMEQQTLSQKNSFHIVESLVESFQCYG